MKSELNKKFKSPSRGCRKSPQATLLSWTSHPFELVTNLFRHEKEGKPLQALRSNYQSSDPADEEFLFAEQLLKEDWCQIIEMPNFIWEFNVPRSLHAQLRSHRHWAWFSESHQWSMPTEFADIGDYFQIPEASYQVKKIEQRAMQDAQKHYGELIEAGTLPALARGVLPMHINLGLLGSCSLRSLFRLFVVRNCNILQGTYWRPLLEQMRIELCEKVDPRFARLTNLRPCDIHQCCQSSLEQETRIKGVDPHRPCPIYLRRFHNAVKG